jgi:hypothetical protein
MERVNNAFAKVSLLSKNVFVILGVRIKNRAIKLVESCNSKDWSGEGGHSLPHLGKFDFIVMAPITVPLQFPRRCVPYFASMLIRMYNFYH